MRQLEASLSYATRDLLSKESQLKWKRSETLMTLRVVNAGDPAWAFCSLASRWQRATVIGGPREDSANLLGVLKTVFRSSKSDVISCEFLSQKTFCSCR